MLSNLPVNPMRSSDVEPSSFWLSDAYESENRYFDIDEINVLQNGTENNELFIIHVNAVSLETRFDSIKAMLARLKKAPSIFLWVKLD